MAREETKTMSVKLIDTLVEVEVSPSAVAQLEESWQDLAKARGCKVVTEDLPNGQVRVAMVVAD
jgi:hypothetical protein